MHKNMQILATVYFTTDKSLLERMITGNSMPASGYNKMDLVIFNESENGTV